MSPCSTKERTQPISEAIRAKLGMLIARAEAEPNPSAKKYAEHVVVETVSILKELSAGADVDAVISEISPETTVIQAYQIANLVCAFSPRGESFRRRWNAWHNRPHETHLFNPSIAKLDGKYYVIAALFDPKIPVTRHEKYPKAGAK